MVEFIHAEDLPPFDESADCPKCGRGRVRAIFYYGLTEKFPCRSDFAPWLLGEHLCRVCERCGYGWCEAPADTKPAARELRAVEGGRSGP
jgi:hypothetical protein